MNVEYDIPITKRRSEARIPEKELLLNKYFCIVLYLKNIRKKAMDITVDVAIIFLVLSISFELLLIRYFPHK